MTDNALPLEYYATVPDWTGEEAIFLLHLGIEPSEYWQSMRPAYEFIDQFTPLLKHFQRFTETFPQFPIDARYAHELTRIQATPKEWLDIYQRFPLRRELPREFIDLIVRHDDDEGETDAPEPESSDNPDKPTPTANPAASVGWKKSVIAAWDAMLRLHKGKPTVEQLVRYLEKHDTEGFIVPSGIADELEWRPSKGGKTKTVSMRTIQDFIGTMPATPRT